MNEEIIPLRKFRVYVGSYSLYYLINIWNSKEDMFANRKANHLPFSDCNAHCFSFDVFSISGDKRIKQPICGEINFYKDCLGMEAITHETCHAIFAFCRRVKWNLTPLNYDDMEANDGEVTDTEEDIALITGKFNREIVEKLRKYKLID
jgi:hypothetical protein